MPDELKPCPFGKDPDHFDSDPCMTRTEDMDFVVWCPSCRAVGRPAKRRKDAIVLWNTRPLEDALRAEVATLRGVVKLQEGLSSEVEPDGRVEIELTNARSVT